MLRVAGWFVASLVLVAAVGAPAAAARRPAAKSESATKPATPKKPAAGKRRGADKNSAEAERYKTFIAKVERFLRRAKGAPAESGLGHADLKRLAFWLEELRGAVTARHWDEADTLRSRIVTLLRRGAKAAADSAHKTGSGPAAKSPAEVPKPVTEATAPEAAIPEAATPEARAETGSHAP
jgi:hypothetical protein